MRTLTLLLKPYWLFVLLAPSAMLLEVCMDLLQPKLMASIVNNGIMTGDLGHVGRTGATMALVACIGLIGGVLCTVFSSIASQKFATDLRQAMFDQVQTFSFGELERFETGSLVTRLTGDVVQLQNLVLTILRMVARSSFLVIGSVVMSFLISPKLILIEFILIPFLVIILQVTLRTSFPLYAQVQQKLDGVNTVLQENLSGIRVVKAFVRMKHEKARYGKANDEYYAAGLKAARTVAFSPPLMSIVLNAGIVTALWYGGAFYLDQTLPIGELIAFLAYISQLLSSLLSLGNQVMVFSRGKASAERINAVLTTGADPNVAEPFSKRDNLSPRITAGRIEFSHVHYHYGFEKNVLHDLNFTIEPGQTVGIVGTNGSGKSTLVGLIPRIYEPSEGIVRIDDEDVQAIDNRELYRHVGVVLQQAHLFSGSVRDNIRFGNPEATAEMVEVAARAAQAHDFILKLPNGYDTELGQRGVNLSGGQKQRISIARTLLTQPKIIILDDSTSAVDLRTEARLRSSLRQVAETATCLIIAQRISSVQDADRILVLENGLITADGTHEELLTSSKLYCELFESQQGMEEPALGNESDE
ncbi:MAG: ABC transporter ATP-binding protein/permease [Gorillibacterium sp.]|nr:ABC transporter ATP-binding protein/permease [Gorillibacterium sp.]